MRCINYTTFVLILEDDVVNIICHSRALCLNIMRPKVDDTCLIENQHCPFIMHIIHPSRGNC
jgi:hypothetical protein